MKHLDLMFRRVLVTLLLLSVASVSFSQYVDLYERPYNTALGIRVGGTSGVSIKHFYTRSAAFEGLIGTFGNGFSLTGLLERHANAFDAKGLNWYWGAGAHVAFYNGNSHYMVGG